MATISGGDKLEAALRELSAKIDKPGTLRVGFLERASYPDGKPVAMIAAIQEFGAPARGIPPRPFFRSMIAAKQNEWAPALAAILKQNGYDAPQALALLGDGIAGQLRQSVRDTKSPGNAASTIAKKGFDDPLIDTGHLFQSIDSEVKS